MLVEKTDLVTNVENEILGFFSISVVLTLNDGTRGIADRRNASASSRVSRQLVINFVNRFVPYTFRILLSLCASVLYFAFGAASSLASSRSSDSAISYFSGSNRSIISLSSRYYSPLFLFLAPYVPQTPIAIHTHTRAHCVCKCKVCATCSP